MRVLLVLVFVALAAAQDYDYCGPLERLKVKHQWGEIFSVSQQRELFSRNFWTEFFFEDPSAREMFSRVRGDNIWSPEFMAHSLRVLGGLDLSISLLAEEDVFNAAMVHLKAQHDPRGITDDHWELFKNTLAVIVARYDTGGRFDADAWKACANKIAGAIR